MRAIIPDMFTVSRFYKQGVLTKEKKLWQRQEDLKEAEGQEKQAQRDLRRAATERRRSGQVVEARKKTTC